MAIEPFEVTLIYSDGTSETRMSTPAEMAQRQKDLETFEVDRLAREAAIAEREAARASAQAKLAALGLTEAEVQALLP